MALKVINKINGRLRFLYRKNRCLLPHLERLLCNAITQLHFDYACSAWYPNLNKKFESKLQTIQNKCIRFCLRLDTRSHIGIKEFEQITWLPVSKTFNQCTCFNAFDFFNENCPLYLHDLHKPSGQDQINTRSSVLKLKHPSRRTCSGQNALSHVTPTVWNNSTTCLKLSNTLNSFKHGVKEHFFSRNSKTKSKIILLIKAMHVASISNCCLIFGNVSTSKGARTILILLSFWNWFNY